MQNKKYKTTESNRFYPGRISLHRAQQIQNFEVSIDDFTVDDLVHAIAKSGTTILYVMFDIIEGRWGKEAAIKVFEEYSYRRAKNGYTRWLKKNGVTSGTPELMAAYQDLMHATSGPAASAAYTTYDAEKCTIIRTSCFYHTFRPEGKESLCKYTEGFMKGYMEADPAIRKVERPKCMAYGDNCCIRTIWYK